MDGPSLLRLTDMASIENERDDLREKKDYFPPSARRTMYFATVWCRKFLSDSAK